MILEGSKFCVFWLILLIFVVNLELSVGLKCEFENSDNSYLCNVIPDSRKIKPKQFSGNIDDDVGRMKLNGTINGISHLTQSELTPFCQKFNKIKKIDVDNIKSVDENLFRQCRNLMELRMKHSAIEEIPKNLFVEASKLTQIYLSFNKLRTLPEDLFINQKKLNGLHLHQNQIAVLPPNIFKSLTELEWLNLSGNKIKSLNPKWFENLQSLKKLKLNDNEIEDLPKNVFVNLKKLERIKLNNNQLTTIHSDSFGVLRDLKYVNLGYNKINAIDRKLTENTKFVWLDLGHNVCSNELIDDNSNMKQKLNNCIKNYQPRQDSSDSVATRIDDTETTTTEIKCGTRANFVKGLIHGGTSISRGEYPWNVALIASEGYLFCGGTLVSSKHVVTSAHCMKGKYESHEYGTEDITIMLGVHNYKKSDELGRISAKVKSINVHQHWNIDVPSFDADIAFLELVNEVKFSNYIRPICLADEDSEVAEVSQGTVVGFGLTGNGSLSDIANKLEISIRDYHSCISNNPDHQSFASARTFCGGPADGRGVCDGDSGSGVYVQHKNAFYLRGIVSNSLVNDATMECDTHKEAIFTDVTQYYEWINRLLI